MRVLAFVIAALSVAACGGGDGGGGGGGARQNQDPDGVYGFNGADWSLDENEAVRDVWLGPNDMVMLVYPDAAISMTAEEWATDEYGGTAATNAQLDFAPEPLPNGGYWWGWYFGGSVYESYYTTSSRSLHVELQTYDLPKSEAAAILGSFVLSN